MEDEHKTKKQLLRELKELRSQNTELERSISGDVSADLTMDVTYSFAESILATLRDPIIILDKDLKVISANRSFYTTFKTTPDETIGSFIYDLKNKEWDIPKLRELLEEVISKKQAFDDFEISHEFRDIGHKVLLLNTREIYRKDIGTTVLLLAFEDITEHKRLQDLLIDSEELYRRLFETANDGIVLLEKDQGKITHSNPAFEEMLGYSKKEIVANKLQNFVVLPDSQDFQTIMHVLNKEGIIKFDDVPLTTKSGRGVDSEIYFVDRAKLVQCNIRDITEHKRQEEAQRKSEEKFRTIFNNSSDAIFIHDTSGQFLEVNNVACERLGYTRDELLEMTLMDIDTPEAARISPEHIRHLHQEGFISFEGAHQRKDGHQFPVEITSRLIDYEGETWILSTVRDITKRKQADKALQQKSRELEERVKELDCLYGLSRLIEQPGISRQELMQSTVELIPFGWQYPDMTCARLLLEGEAFYSSDSRETAWKQSADIVANGSSAGRIEVFYLQEAPESVEGPFLSRERELLENIAESLGQYLEREQTREALRRSENYYRAIFEISGSAMFTIEEDTTISHINSNFEKLTGYSREEVEARMPWTELVHSNDLPWMKEQHFLRRQDPAAAFKEYAFRYLHRSGEVRHCFLTIDMIPGTRRSVVSLIDITERKKAEKELQAAHDKLGSVVELNVDGIMVLDQEGSILFLNPAAAEMLGQDQDELWGEQFGHPLIPGSNTEIELLSTSGEARVVELRGRETEWSGQAALLVSFRDMTERKRDEERIYNLAYYDELTGLPNRRLFYDRLKQVAARSEHFGHGAVFLMDIPKLREVNDTLGQQAGDELIEEVARRISDTVFEEDTVARVSGGEFIVLSEEKSTADGARNLGGRILERIGLNLELSGRLVYPEVNIGFILFPDWGTDPDTLIKQADIALIEAKKNASRIQEYTGQEDWISQLFHLEHDLKQALENEEFFLCYQSQIDLRTGRILGLEALLRWKHPQRGIISPGEFIPVLEQTGMIAFADAWVIHRVCKQSRSWQEEGILVRTSVNLSAQELNDEATIEVVRAALEENGVHPESLEVEITETDLMENVDRASRILQTFSSWGVRVALDDFGKGYSSLSYLQKLAINTIKIDKQFVDGLPDNQDSVTLVQTIIAMAHNLGKMVLAEGVESEEQQQKLLELGCDYGQGFLWDRPRPAQEVIR
ncbi:MAG: PAS domain S-box protein [Desulfohalobiaceae bacterium]